MDKIEEYKKLMGEFKDILDSFEVLYNDPTFHSQIKQLNEEHEMDGCVYGELREMLKDFAEYCVC